MAHGGAQALTNAFVEALKRHGGELALRTEVTHIRREWMLARNHWIGGDAAFVGCLSCRLSDAGRESARSGLDGGRTDG